MDRSPRRQAMAVSSGQREPRPLAGGRPPHHPPLHAIDENAPSLADLFAPIGGATKDEAGVTRDAFGAKETIAGDILIAYARSHGLDAGYDRVGSFIAALPE